MPTEAQSRAHINRSCQRRTAVYSPTHSVSLAEPPHCKSLSHCHTCFFCVFKRLKAQRAGASDWESPPLMWLLEHLDWLEFSASVRRADWQQACKCDSVLKMQLASCYWLNASILIIFSICQSCWYETQPSHSIGRSDYFRQRLHPWLSGCHTSLPY